MLPNDATAKSESLSTTLSPMRVIKWRKKSCALPTHSVGDDQPEYASAYPAETPFFISSSAFWMR